jgi:hypothetical protein
VELTTRLKNKIKTYQQIKNHKKSHEFILTRLQTQHKISQWLALAIASTCRSPHAVLRPTVSTANCHRMRVHRSTHL